MVIQKMFHQMMVRQDVKKINPKMQCCLFGSAPPHETGANGLLQGWTKLFITVCLLTNFDSLFKETVSRVFQKTHADGFVFCRTIRVGKLKKLSSL